jgi:hypothetical protein
VLPTANGDVEGWKGVSSLSLFVGEGWRLGDCVAKDGKAEGDETSMKSLDSSSLSSLGRKMLSGASVDCDEDGSSLLMSISTKLLLSCLEFRELRPTERAAIVAKTTRMTTAAIFRSLLFDIIMIE